MNIIKNYIERNYNISNNRKIDYIVIHYTAGASSKQGNALISRNWFNNQNAGCSAHYIIDDETIIQAVDDKNISWHCGTKGTYYHPKCRNNNSIGIELCSNYDNFTNYKECLSSDPDWYFTEQTKEKGAELTAYLMKKYNIPIENVIRHYDVTHKDCPSIYVDENKEGEKGWLDFKNRVNKYLRSDIIMYNTIDECPSYFKDAIKWYIDNGYLKGTDKGLQLDYNTARILTILYRVLNRS